VTHPGDADWWRSAVVYQVYPRSFSDHDGDGTGDILGVIDRLPYLAQLGIDAIWVSPWYPSPMADSGYDVSDYRDIHPDFGTLEQADTPALGDGTLTWDDDAPKGVLSFTREPGFRCVVNFGPGSYEIPDGAEVLISSGLSDPRSVGIDETVWLRV
jgi:alpha-glucosidase